MDAFPGPLAQQPPPDCIQRKHQRINYRGKEGGVSGGGLTSKNPYKTFPPNINTSTTAGK